MSDSIKCYNCKEIIEAGKPVHDLFYKNSEGGECRKPTCNECAAGFYYQQLEEESEDDFDCEPDEIPLEDL